MKKRYWVLIVILVLVILFMMVFRFGREDSWIKDDRGVWVKHGVPSETPDYVQEQQEIIKCSLGLYNIEKNKRINLSSQCLGSCRDYAVDIVHVPRNAEDNLIENQCEDYRQGKVNHFLELDKEGEIVRIK